MASKKQIVIVGAGGAGGALARTLSGQLDSASHQITLIASRPFFPFYVAALRTLVTDEGSLENQMLIPLDKLFINGNGTFKQGVVTGIEAEKGPKRGGRVLLADGQSVDYDVLALAPGSRWESLLDFPLELKQTREHIEEWRKKFRNAKKVVIGGGGAVGIGESSSHATLQTRPSHSFAQNLRENSGIIIL
jgi:apoptosis-inducing factor 2